MDELDLVDCHVFVLLLMTAAAAALWRLIAAPAFGETELNGAVLDKDFEEIAGCMSRSEPDEAESSARSAANMALCLMRMLDAVSHDKFECSHLALPKHQAHCPW